METSHMVTQRGQESGVPTSTITGNAKAATPGQLT
jgi:hypothetical protein